MRRYHKMIITLVGIHLLSGCNATMTLPKEKVKNTWIPTIAYQPISYHNEEHIRKVAESFVKEKVEAIYDSVLVEKSENTYTYEMDQYLVTLTFPNKDLSYQMLDVVIMDETTKLQEEKCLPVQVIDDSAPMIALKETYIEVKEEEISNYQQEATLYANISRVSDNYNTREEMKIRIDNALLNEEIKAGNTYSIVYEVEDTSHNKTTANLTIKIKEKEVPIIHEINIDSALQLLIGKPYVWGGQGPDVFDCSGLVSYVFTLYGYDVSVASLHQQAGTSIGFDESRWRFGDVLSYQDHSGNIVHYAFYVGNHMALHALTSGVQIISLDEVIIGVDGYPETLCQVTRYVDNLK